MTGIYKITTPSNYVYIGQSRRIEERFKQHCRKNRLRPSAIGHSIQKHGAALHKFEVIHELPVDVAQDILNRYELTYIDSYRVSGLTVLNSGECNIGGTITEETRERLRKSHLGKVPPNKGMKLPEWWVEKLRKAQTGKKQKPEHVEKRRATNTGKKRTEETKAKMRISLKGKAGYKKGTRVCSEETKMRIGSANKGRVVTVETREKIRQTLIARNAKNRAA